MGKFIYYCNFIYIRQGGIWVVNWYLGVRCDVLVYVYCKQSLLYLENMLLILILELSFELSFDWLEYYFKGVEI